MNRYEALLLTVPTITQDEARSLESQFEKVVKDAKGSMISFEKWGKYRLSYPVKKNDYGVYFLARFETDNNQMFGDLRSLLAVKLNDLIMRDMITALDVKQSLAYQRPHSLEEAPSREGFVSERRDIDATAADSEGMGEDLDSDDKE